MRIQSKNAFFFTKAYANVFVIQKEILILQRI